MSENVSTKEAIEEREELATEAIGSKNWSVDSYADRLMDDLFGDLERVLDGGSRLPNQTMPPDVISLRSIEVPQIVLPELINPESGQQTVETKAVAAGEKPEEKSGKWVDRLLFGGACASLAILSGLWLWNRGELQRLWTLIQNRGATEEVVVEKTPADLKAEADAEFMRYLEQALEAIDREEKIAAAAQTTSNQVAGTNSGPPEVRVTVNPTLEPVPGGITNNQAEALHRIAIALERISIPNNTVAPTTVIRVPETPPPLSGQTVAPQASAPKPAAQAPAPASSTPKPAAQAPAPASSAPKPATQASAPASSVPKPKLSLGQPVSAPIPSAGIGQVSTPRLATGLGPVSAPIPSPVPTVIAAAPAPAPAPAEPVEKTAAAPAVPAAASVPASSEASETPVPEAAAPAAPAASEPKPAEPAASEAEPAAPEVQPGLPVSNDPSVTHTLTGLLELGDRSAALFEIDGITNRIKIGENIGSSGWTLVEVKNQEAIMRRNGEVRSIYVGQSF